jgi:hypothetical protein
VKRLPAAPSRLDQHQYDANNKNHHKSRIEIALEFASRLVNLCQPWPLLLQQKTVPVGIELIAGFHYGVAVVVWTPKLSPRKCVADDSGLQVGVFLRDLVTRDGFDAYGIICPVRLNL